MAPSATSWRSERARIAGMSSRPNRAPDDPELIEARRNLRALRLEDHVEKVLQGAPPLSDEQRERIAALLRAGAVMPIDRGHICQGGRDALDDLGVIDVERTEISSGPSADLAASRSRRRGAGGGVF